MSQVVVIGGGYAGCAAAAAAAKSGAHVTLLERMEVLGGFGLVAGRFHLRGLPVREELRLMGSDDIFQAIYKCVLHEYVKFPFPKPDGEGILLYDVTKLDSELQKHLRGLAVEVRLQSGAIDLQMTDGRIEAVLLADGEKVQGDAFVDATGGAGPEENCRKYGNGCAMCIMRCPAFGGRVSIAEKAGVKEIKGKKQDGSIGPVNAGYSLLKESLAIEIREELEKKGIVCIPIPQHLVSYKRTEAIAPTVAIDTGFAENVVLADIGAYAKRIAGGWTPLDELRLVPGLERARYGDPYAGSIGNGIRYMAITPREDSLKVPRVDNLFVASEKIGVMGTAAVIVTGVLAGHNAVRKTLGIAPLILPESTMVGNFIAFANKRWNTEEGLRKRYGIPTGLPHHEPGKEKLSAEDKAVIYSRITKNDLLDVISKL